MCPTSSAMTTKDPEVPTVDYYDILGCNPHSDNDQIQTEYRVRARQVHPDKSSMKAGGGNEWNQVREAYEVLSDPVSRAQYDRWRKAKLPVSFSQWRQYPHSQTMHWSFDYQRFIEQQQQQSPATDESSSRGSPDLYDMFRNYQI